MVYNKSISKEEKIYKKIRYYLLLYCILGFILVDCNIIRNTSGPPEIVVDSLVSKYIYQKVFIPPRIDTTVDEIEKTLTIDTLWGWAPCGIEIHNITIEKRGQYNKTYNYYAMILKIDYTKFRVESYSKDKYFKSKLVGSEVKYEKSDFKSNIVQYEVKFQKNDYGEWVLINPDWRLRDF